MSRDRGDKDVEAGLDPGPAQEQKQKPRSDLSDSTEGTMHLKDALNGLVDDIYAICVRYMVVSFMKDNNSDWRSFKRGRWWKICWLLGAVLCTFALQMFMLVLLWHAASIGNAPMEQSKQDLLFRQVGMAHRHLCGLENFNQKLSRLVRLPNITRSDCTHWWPVNAPANYTTAKHCLSQHPVKMKGDVYCQRVLWELNSSWTAYGRGLFNDPPQRFEIDEAGNVVMVKELPDPLQRIDPFFFTMCAFLSLAIVTHQEVKQGLWLCYIAAGCVGVLPPFFGRKSGSKHWRIIDHDVSDAADLPFVIKLLVVFVPILQVIVALAVLATGGVLHLFATTQADLVQIIINSVALAFILDTDNRFGCILGLREDWKYPEAALPRVPTARLANGRYGHSKPDTAGSACGSSSEPSAAVPGIAAARQQGSNAERRDAAQRGNDQAAKPDAAAGSSSGASPTAPQGDKEQKPPGPQQVPSPPAAAKATAWAAASARLKIGWRRRLFLGHLYMAVVGLLVYAEVCLLAPQSAAQMLAFVVVTFVEREAPRLGATVNGRGISNTGIVTQLMTMLKTPTVDWFSSNSLWFHWSFGGILDGYHYGASSNPTFWPINHDETRSAMSSEMQVKTVYALFAVSTFLFVVVLGARILPSSSPGWAAILMCTQVLLVLLVQAQDSTFKPECHFGFLPNLTIPTADISIFGNTTEAIKKREACPRNFWWMVVLSVFGLFWLVLFWALPLLFEYQASGFKYGGAVVKRVPQTFKIKRRSVVTCVPSSCKNQRRKKKKAVAGQAA